MPLRAKTRALRPMQTIARLYGRTLWLCNRPDVAPGQLPLEMDALLNKAPLPTSSKTRAQSANTQRWFSKLLTSASLATDTRPYPNSLPLIFRWPPVLAWRRHTTAGGILAMLIFVPL